MDTIIPFLSNRVQSLDKKVKKVSGALLLSDISGFTAMSESLAREGKEGIEELTHLLNNYFDVMLRVIQKHGGDVIKFGGDALLVGFYYNPAENDVKACAYEMMAETEKFKGIRTCAGIFDIAMKIVGKSGQWNELALGDDRRREHFLCGRTIRELVLMEDNAKSGDVIIKWEEFVKSEQRERKTISTRKLISYLPQGVADLIGKGSFGEHRSVSVVFINFHGYDEETPETKPFQELFKEVISIIEKYGGTIYSIIPHSHGSNMMLLFGAPRAHENDAERAVLTAIELSRINIHPLSLKVGVCTGFVYAGFVGSDWRKEYTVIGDTVNTAERLMETAKVGESIVSEVAEHLTRTKVGYQELESARVKGKEEPLKRFSPSGTKEERYFKFEFVGRAKETKEIIKAIKDGGKAVILKGEAGIGKSRLLYEIKKELEPTFKILEGYTDEIKGALHIFTSMIVREAGIHPDELEITRKGKLENYVRKIDKGELERRIPFIGAMLFGIGYPDSLYEKTDAKLRFENLCDALRYYIEYQKKPTVVIFDDIQWVTKDDLKIIAYITRILLTLSKERNRLTFVFTGRPEPDIIDTLPLVKEIETLRLSLQALAKESIHLLAEELLKNKPLPEDITEIVFKRIEGNPFYLEQFLLDLIEKGLIKEKDDKWVKTIKFKEEDIPENIFSAIMARIDRLEKMAKETLSVGSVVGMEFSKQMVVNVLKEPNVSLYLAETEKEHLTYRKAIKEIEYIFSHAMIRDVVYESMLHERRKKLHKSVGETIENLYKKAIERFYGVLAYHFNHAGEWEKALDYNLKAGEKAKKEYHNESAIKYFSRAAEIVEKELSAKRVELYASYKGLGDVYMSISNYPLARGYYQNAVTVIGTIDKEKLVDVLNGLAETYDRQSNYAEALKTAEEACSISHKIKYKKGIATSLNNMGIVHWRQGRYKEALKYYEESLEIRREIGDKYGIAGSLGNIGNVHLSQGRYEEALKCYEESLEIFREISDKRGIAISLHNIGVVHMEQGRYEEALKYHEDSLKIRREIGNKSGIAGSLGNIGNVHWSQGRYEEALKYNGESLEIFREIGDKKSIAGSLSNIGVIHDEQGRYESALKCYEESLGIRREISDKQGIAMSLINIGNVHIDQGRYEEALKCYEESLKVSREIGDKRGIAKSLKSIGITYISLGLFAYGTQKVEEAVNIFEEIGAKGELLTLFASLIYGYTEVGDIKKAKDYVERAQEIEKETTKNTGLLLSISKFYEGSRNLQVAKKYAEQTLEKAKELKELGNQAGAYIQLCELLWKNSPIQIQEYAEESLSIAEKLKSLPLLWKSHYWLYKGTGDKNHLKKAKENLEEQFKHLLAEHLNAFKQYIKKYTGEEL